jgi:hypothetical protein
MNAILERVNFVCKTVREINQAGVTFKKLITSMRSLFKQQNFDLTIKTKKDKHLESFEFYVNAYYDAEDDFNNDTPIEVIVHHNFDDVSVFTSSQLTDFLIQIYDATVHEYRHQKQSSSRSYQTYSSHIQTPYEEYLTDPDEVDAYALSIAIELLRVMHKERAKKYLTRIHTLAKMRVNNGYVSPNLKAYVEHFGINTTTKKLSKKVYKHLDTIDKHSIFM